MADPKALKDIFSIVVDDRINANDAYVVSSFKLVPKVQMTFFEGREVHQVLLSDWPEGFSEEHPLGTVKDIDGNNEVVIACEPVSQFLFEGQLIKNVASADEQVVDARPRGRFEGTTPEPWPGRRSGHIPGSRNVPYAELFDAETGLMKSVDALRAAFKKADVDIARPVVTTCGSGVSAAVLTLALCRLGVRDTALYDGSWAEWGLPDGPPMATGK